MNTMQISSFADALREEVLDAYAAASHPAAVRV